MARTRPRRPVAGVYIRLLERLLPRLEELLADRLNRLESKVAVHECRYGCSAALTTGKSTKRRQPVDAELAAGSPSVILLGARLRTDQQFCRTLIHRAAALLGARLS